VVGHYVADHQHPGAGKPFDNLQGAFVAHRILHQHSRLSAAQKTFEKLMFLLFMENFVNHFFQQQAY